MTIFNRTHLLALAILFSLVALPVRAQEVPQVTGGATVGAQTGSGLNDSSKLQEFETVPKGVSLFNVDFGWKNASRYFVQFEGSKLGLADQFASVQAGKKGTWTATFSLDQNPNWISNTARTLYNESSPGVFNLSDGMRANLQRIWSPATSDPKAPSDSNDNRFWSVRDYVNGSQPIDLGYERKTGRGAFDFTGLKDMDITFSYQRETRNGNQPIAFTAGPGIDEIANPVDYTTDDSRIEVNYNKSRYFVNGVLAYNTFTNGVPYSTIDNPVRLNNTDFFWTANTVTNTSANATARLWNAPDNAATSFDFSTGMTLPAHHKVTFTGSYDRMTMDRTLIPQATNPNLNTNPPGAFTLVPEYPSINAALNQTLLQVNFSGDPKPLFGYSASFRRFNLNNDKPVYVFHSTVNADGGASYSATGNTSGEDMGGYQSWQYRLEGHLSLPHGVRVGVNAGQSKFTYEDRLYEDVKDTTVNVTGDANLHFGMFHGSYGILHRRPGAISDEVLEGGTGGPLTPGADMRDVAFQNGRLYNATLTLTPLDKTALTLYTQGVTSDFPTVTIGLTGSTVRDYGFDFVYAFTDRVSANAGYVYEKYHMDTNLWYAANGTFSTPATNTTDQYSNATQDRVDTYQAGLRFELVPKRFDVSTDYNYSKGRSDSGFTIVPGGQAAGNLQFPTSATANFPVMGPYLNYPQVFNKTTIWKTWFNYHLHENVVVSFLYWRQVFDQADWAYDNLGPYLQPGSALYATTPGATANIYPLLDPSANRALLLGVSVPNYNANIYRVSLTYRF